jgi:hypothetical protein
MVDITTSVRIADLPIAAPALHAGAEHSMSRGNRQGLVPIPIAWAAGAD